MTAGAQALERSARADRWALGVGEALLWAPPVPRAPDVPGFWDDAHWHDRPLGPLFAVAVLDAEGRELAPRVVGRRWTPSELVTEYRFAQGLAGVETRTIHPGGVAVSEWRLTAHRPTRVHVIAWTAFPPGGWRCDGVRWGDGALTVPRADGLTVALAAPGTGVRWAAATGEADPSVPAWRRTPFVERWRGDGLGDTVAVEDGGALFAAVQRPVQVTAGGATATLAARVGAADAPVATRGTGSRGGSFAAASRTRWTAQLDGVPALASSDPFLERWWWTRWATWMRLGAGRGVLAEGIGPEHRPRAAAAVEQLLGLRWHPDPAVAWHLLEAFVAAARPDDGAFPDRLFPAVWEGHDVAGWAAALHAVHTVHPDAARIAALGPAVARHVEQVHAAREAGDGWYRVRVGGSEQVGVDRTATMAHDAAALAALAPMFGADPAPWHARAEAARAALDRAWVDAAAWYADQTLDGTPLPATDAASALAFAHHPSRVEHLVAALGDPARFATPFPIPARAVSAPGFDPLRRGGTRRDGRPVPDRTSLVVNARILRVLAPAVAGGDTGAQAAVAALLPRTIHLTFQDGDLRAATSYADYHPVTGHAGLARGLDDHVADALVDAVVTCVAGLHVTDEALLVAPVPLGLERAALHGVRVRGRRVDVTIEGDHLTVTVDGHPRSGALGAPVTCPW